MNARCPADCIIILAMIRHYFFTSLWTCSVASWPSCMFWSYEYFAIFLSSLAWLHESRKCSALLKGGILQFNPIAGSFWFQMVYQNLVVICYLLVLYVLISIPPFYNGFIFIFSSFYEQIISKKQNLFLIYADTMLMLSFTIFITICSEN